MRFFGLGLMAVLLMLNPHATKAEEPMPPGPPQDDPNNKCGGCEPGKFCMEIWPPCQPPPYMYGIDCDELMPHCVDEGMSDGLPLPPAPPSPPSIPGTPIVTTTYQYDPNEACGGCYSGMVCRMVTDPECDEWEPCKPFYYCMDNKKK